MIFVITYLLPSTLLITRAHTQYLVNHIFIYIFLDWIWILIKIYSSTNSPLHSLNTIKILTMILYNFFYFFYFLNDSYVNPIESESLNKIFYIGKGTNPLAKIMIMVAWRKASHSHKLCSGSNRCSKACTAYLQRYCEQRCRGITLGNGSQTSNLSAIVSVGARSKALSLRCKALCDCWTTSIIYLL